MHEPDLQVEFQLGHLCTNRCVFCVSGQMSEQNRAPQLPEEPLRAQLQEARSRGAKKVTFLGGEPTIQRSFFSLLRFVVELGFDEIVIFTNGTMTPRDSFRERTTEILKGLGPNWKQRVIWRFSLQGGQAQAHDTTTTRAGSFARIIQSLEVLHDEGARLSANICVVSTNYASIEGLAELAARFELENLHLDMVRSRDAGERTEAYFRWLMPRYTDMVPSFRALVERCDALLGEDFDLNLGNLPYCVAPDISHRIHHDGELTVTISASGQGTTKQGIDKYEDKRRDKHKLPACADCIFDDRCGGYFDLYAKFYGHDELRPISAEALWRLDAAGHHFVRLAKAKIEALIETRSELRLGRIDEPAAEIEAHLALPDNKGWALVLRRSGRRPRRQGWFTLRSGRVEASLLNPMPQTPGAAEFLGELLESLGQVLGGDGPFEVDLHGMSEAWKREVVRRQAREVAHKRSRRLGLNMAKDLLGLTLAGLKQSALRRDKEADWVEVIFSRGPQQLTLRIDLSPSAGGRPNLKHDTIGLNAEEIASFSAALSRHLKTKRLNARRAAPSRDAER